MLMSDKELAKYKKDERYKIAVLDLAISNGIIWGSRGVIKRRKGFKFTEEEKLIKFPIFYIHKYTGPLTDDISECGDVKTERLSKMKRVKRTLTRFITCGTFNEESQTQKAKVDPVPSSNYFINETDRHFNFNASGVAGPTKSLHKVKVKESKSCTKVPAKMSTIVEEITEEPCCSKDLLSAIKNAAPTEFSSVEETSFTEK